MTVRKNIDPTSKSRWGWFDRIFEGQSDASLHQHHHHRRHRQHQQLRGGSFVDDATNEKQKNSDHNEQAEAKTKVQYIAHLIQAR